MSQPLAELIAAVRRRARLWLVLHALVWLSAVVVLATLVCGTLDYWLRPNDLGVRVFCSLALLLAAAAATWRFLIPAVCRPLSDVALAQRIERRFPALGQRLASAVEFMQQADDAPAAGSAELRRALVIEVSQAASGVRAADVVDVRPALKSAWPALGLMLLAVVIGASSPVSTGVALRHLYLPWQSVQWPRLHQLAWASPVTRIARGQSFEAKLVDRNGTLPDEVRIHYRFENADGTTSEEVERMQPLADAMVALRDNVVRPFSYRAEGGDDRTMPWTAVKVIDPPAAESLEIVLHPPAYTGLASETTGRRIVALVGTQIELHGTATKPLKSATLKQEKGPELACALSGSGRTFSLTADQWKVEKSGRYWFVLRDSEGLTGGGDDRWELQAVPDSPPNVSIEQPPGSLMLTAQAVLPLKIIAADNLALHSVSLAYTRSDATDRGEVELPLLARPDQPEPRSGGLAAVGAGERQTIEHRWSLADMNLAPGVRIAFHASATDYKPQTSLSDERLLTIITADDFRQRLAGKQAFILGELRRILKMQQEVRGHVAGLSRQFHEVGQMRRQDANQLQGVELNQRQVARSLASPGEGVLTQIDAALDEVRINGLDSPNTERQFQSLRQEIRRLAAEELPPLESELTGALKSVEAGLAAANISPAQADASTPAAPRAIQSLDAAAAGQDRVIAALDQLLDGYSQWINYRQFTQDVSQIRRELADLTHDTQQLGAKTLTKEFRELSPQQQTDLRQLSQRQTDMQRRFDKTQQQLESAVKALADSDPLAAQTLSDALHAARQSGISGQMAAGSRSLEGNQIGQALEGQKGIDKSLAEMLDILSGKREHELTHLVSKLRAAEQQLQQLREQQQALVSRLQAAGQIADETQRRAELKRLAAAQQKQQEEIERLARQLKRLQANQAAEKTAGAAEKSAQAAAAGQQGSAQDSLDKAAAAQRDLDDAQQQLAERRKQAESDLASEQLARIEDALKGLLPRQQGVLDETLRLEQLRSDGGGHFSRTQSLSVQGLARQQAGLADETELLAEKIAAAEVFHLALTSAHDNMQRAAALLTQRETGPPTQDAERSALARFQQLKEALAKDPSPKPDEKKPGDKGGDGQKSDQPSGDGIQQLAQLKLLKLMQQDVLTRTRAAEAALADPAKIDENQLQAIAALRREQQQLAEMLSKLIQPPRPAAPEDDPEKLPDLRQNGPPKGKIQQDEPAADRANRKETP